MINYLFSNKMRIYYLSMKVWYLTNDSINYSRMIGLLFINIFYIYMYNSLYILTNYYEYDNRCFNIHFLHSFMSNYYVKYVELAIQFPFCSWKLLCKICQYVQLAIHLLQFPFCSWKLLCQICQYLELYIYFLIIHWITINWLCIVFYEFK